MLLALTTDAVLPLQHFSIDCAVTDDPGNFAKAEECLGRSCQIGVRPCFETFVRVPSCPFYRRFRSTVTLLPLFAVRSKKRHSVIYNVNDYVLDRDALQRIISQILRIPFP